MPLSQPPASIDDPSIIEVDRLNFSYGTSRALHDVTLAIPERKVTAFIGPIRVW